MTILVAIEGLDGSGKSTQASLLSKALEKSGHPSILLHFPRYDTAVFGAAISKFLRGDFGPVGDVHPWLVSLLFAGDRAEAASDIEHHLEKGVVVIADRYLFSNLAFQSAKLTNDAERTEFKRWLWELEVTRNQLPVPDLTAFLDAPLDFVAQKLSEFRHTGDRSYLGGRADIHESDMKLQVRVRSEYLELAKSFDSIEVIKCSRDGRMRDPSEIHSAVLNMVERSKLLKTPRS